MDQLPPMRRIMRTIQYGFDVIKTVPATINDGVTVLLNSVSPARKRRRLSQQTPSSANPLPSDQPLPSEHAPKRLRLSDASATNAVGASVETPAAFHPTQDFLATGAEPHVFSRLPYCVSPHQAGLQSAIPPRHRFFSDYSHQHPSQLSHPYLRPSAESLNLKHLFHYPTPRSTRRHSFSFPPHQNRRQSSSSRPSAVDDASRAKDYVQTIDDRLRTPTSTRYPTRSAQRRLSSAVQSLSQNAHNQKLARPPPSSPLPTYHRIDRPRFRQTSADPRQSARPLRYVESLGSTPHSIRKRKRDHTERKRRAQTAAAKKLSHVNTILRAESSPGRKSDASILPSSQSRPLTDSDPFPLPRLYPHDNIFAQKLQKSRAAARAAAALNRLSKSMEQTRYKEMERWIIEQDHHEIERKRAESRKMLELQAKLRKADSDIGQAEDPPEDESIFDVQYWSDADCKWDEYSDKDAIAERKKKITVDTPKSAFSPLTPVAMKRLRTTFSDESNCHRQLVKVEGCVIHGEDIRRLEPNRWLNDEIVNGYMALLTARSEQARVQTNGKSPQSRKGGSPHVKIMNSFFYTTLVQKKERDETAVYNYSNVRRWTRRFDVFSFDVMLIPINQSNVHWTLGVVDFKNKTVEHLDSMGTGGSPTVRKYLLRWIQDEAEHKKKSVKASEWSEVSRPVPMQENSDDCGVFLCKYADFICRGWKSFTFSQKHMRYFRGRIAHELLMGKA